MGEEGQRGSFRKPLPGLGGALEARGVEAWGEALSFAMQIRGVVVSGGEAMCSCRSVGGQTRTSCVQGRWLTRTPSWETRPIWKQGCGGCLPPFPDPPSVSQHPTDAGTPVQPHGLPHTVFYLSW